MHYKNFYTSKTLIINFLVIVAALLTYVTGSEFPVELTPENVAIAAGVLGGINFVLRFLTNTGVK